MAKKWNGDSTASDKLLLLFTILLFNRRSFSLSELSSPSCLNSSKATVLRLLRHLENAKACVLVHEKKGRESWYSLERRNLPELAVNPESISLLALCRDFIPHLLPENLREEMTHVLARLAGPQGLHVTQEGGSLTKGAIDYNPFQDFLATLRTAIRRKRACRIEYAASQGKPAREHIFAPQKLLAYHETLYVEGWLLDPEHPEKRKYTDPLRLALQRFKSCGIMDVSSAHLPSLTPCASEFFGLSAEDPFLATVHFAPEAATYVRERRWSDGQTLEDLPDGSVKLTFEAGNFREALAWVLSFGASAVVCEPAWFARAVRRELRMAARNYRKKPADAKEGIEDGENGAD